MERAGGGEGLLLMDCVSPIPPPYLFGCALLYTIHVKQCLVQIAEGYNRGVIVQVPWASFVTIATILQGQQWQRRLVRTGVEGQERERQWERRGAEGQQWQWHWEGRAVEE